MTSAMEVKGWKAKHLNDEMRDKNSLPLMKKIGISGL
jgi:hypothetical protein